MLSIGLLPLFFTWFSSYATILNFSSKNLRLRNFFLQFGNFLKSYWLLPFDFFCSRHFPSVIIRFSFPVFFSSSLLLFRLLLFYRFSSNFFVPGFLLTIVFDSDVCYIRFLSYSRKPNLTVLWPVPPFLKLWGNSLSFCWSVPPILNFSPHIYMKYIFIYRLDYVVFCISYVEIIITRYF